MEKKIRTVNKLRLLTQTSKVSNEIRLLSRNVKGVMARLKGLIYKSKENINVNGQE